MKKTWVEVTCDWCNGAEHFLSPMSNHDLEKEGYVVVGREHFCDHDCACNAMDSRNEAIKESKNIIELIQNSAD